MKEQTTDRTNGGTSNVFTIPGTEVRMMSSCNENRTYHIFISKPSTPPPPAGYPVIYLLDANSVFGTMTEAVRIQGRRPEKTGVIPAVIVGIGYETAVAVLLSTPPGFYNANSPIEAAGKARRQRMAGAWWSGGLFQIY